MTYLEWKEKEKKEFNELPIFFAFSNEQMDKALEERGAKKTDKIYALGAGGYYLEKDAEVVREYFNRPDDLSELIKNPEFAEDAFYYEMGNHEYHINWQADWDVCSCFGDVKYSDSPDELEKYFDELGFEEQTRVAYLKAKRRFLKDAIDNEWY